MTDRDYRARRALDALKQAVEASPDDFDHPGPEVIEALAEDRLPDADRDAVTSHVTSCSTCAEDLDDLLAIRAALDATPAVATGGRRGRAALVWAAGIAAMIALAAWMGTRPESPAPAQATAEATQPAQGVLPSPAGPAPVASALTAAEQQFVASARAAGRIDLGASAQMLIGRQGMLLGRAEPAAAFAPIAPAGTIVLSLRPTLSWSMLPGATGYTVAVFDERFTEVARGRNVASTSWTVGATLRRGAVYVWQVTAHLPSGDVTAPAPPQPEARFQVAGEATAATAAEQQSRLADEPLALGILLAGEGLVADAVAALQRAAARPATAREAVALLDSLRAQGAPMTTNPAQ
ncbi:MAG: hypothetical protein FJW14_13250 [Acidimicrobiia bacterium]|nr:hypothetical protein [Acidimicrobiia bacterium]